MTTANFSHACYLCRQPIPESVVGCVPCAKMVARSSRINNAEKDLDKAVRALLSISCNQATVDVLLAIVAGNQQRRLRMTIDPCETVQHGGRTQCARYRVSRGARAGLLSL